MSQYDELLSHDLLDTRVDHFDFPQPEQLRLSYERARAVCQKSGITVEDVVKLGPKFWEFYRHPIFCRDSAMGTALSIHWNLCIGTIGAYAHCRPDLAPLLEKLIRFDLCGEFLLTEIGRGLDARNLETTATLQSDGSFDLHTPRESAAKAMPPTSPAGGIGRVGVVFARLMVNGADHGVKPFVVNLSDEKDMLPGITSRLLPRRCGAKVLDHAITTFDHVCLNAGSLLGSLDRADNQRAEFFRQIHRVAVGTLSLSMGNIPSLQLSALIAGTYSSRRRVAADGGREGIPIIQFSTQHRPILDAIVQSWAYDAFADEAISHFLNNELSFEARHAIVVCFKTAVGTDTQTTINELAERCGWQGLFAHNEIIELAMALRGNAIAEGDYTVLCIRLVSEVLLGRYKLPEPKDRTCLLAKHEAGVWQEAHEMLLSLGITNYRSEEVNAHLLPRCRDMVKAAGHRMAYEAAVASGKVKPAALRLFESSCIKSDLSWYCQSEGFKRNEFLANDVKAVKEALPLLQEFLTQRRPLRATVAPIVHETSWNEFFESLPIFQPTRTVSSASPALYRL
ncbi:acyl-CoA dehydrogenase/oxidase [Xylaria bambusicola]|uniref:acyl-CoA dehydrogenase/oxidase n=1 Tax=Xylaria bambusicola TaxID=326684 RepID=UPI00200844AE|nr:acyl-CoA dehydrogenase/oxidase [Xylaria bambusicola]KAI0505453.1 acyl-CoA dehydrogenase/oxidase [Xylaria bambusicola]